MAAIDEPPRRLAPIDGRPVHRDRTPLSRRALVIVIDLLGHFAFLVIRPIQLGLIGGLADATAAVLAEEFQAHHTASIASLAVSALAFSQVGLAIRSSP